MSAVPPSPSRPFDRPHRRERNRPAPRGGAAARDCYRSGRHSSGFSVSPQVGESGDSNRPGPDCAGHPKDAVSQRFAALAVFVPRPDRVPAVRRTDRHPLALYQGPRVLEIHMSWLGLIISLLVIGLIAGFIARAVVPGKQQHVHRDDLGPRHHRLVRRRFPRLPAVPQGRPGRILPGEPASSDPSSARSSSWSSTWPSTVARASPDPPDRHGGPGEPCPAHRGSTTVVLLALFH